ncbi:MAG: NUDIX hydrolase [Desulfomonilia bacterium]|nr:NUDIX hydrolase [Desulfomonilia bacterium]
MTGSRTTRCPGCGQDLKVYRNPVPTVDIIIEYSGGIVLISRKNPPLGWALPGGFVDYGETLAQAARREAQEETGLVLDELRMFHAYSDPARDPRGHTITTVFVAKGSGTLQARDDAERAGVFDPQDLPQPLAFDHGEILEDYLTWKKTGTGGLILT